MATLNVTKSTGYEDPRLAEQRKKNATALDYFGSSDLSSGSSSRGSSAELNKLKDDGSNSSFDANRQKYMPTDQSDASRRDQWLSTRDSNNQGMDLTGRGLDALADAFLRKGNTDEARGYREREEYRKDTATANDQARNLKQIDANTSITTGAQTANASMYGADAQRDAAKYQSDVAKYQADAQRAIAQATREASLITSFFGASGSGRDYRV